MANKLKQQAAKIKEAERKAHEAAASLQRAVSSVSPQQAQRLVTLLAPKAQRGISAGGAAPQSNRNWQANAPEFQTAQALGTEMYDPGQVAQYTQSNAMPLQPSPDIFNKYNKDLSMTEALEPSPTIFAPTGKPSKPELMQRKQDLAAEASPATPGIPVSAHGMAFPRSAGAITQAQRNLEDIAEGKASVSEHLAKSAEADALRGKAKASKSTASIGEEGTTSTQGGLPSALSPEMQELSQRMTNAYFSDLPRHLQPVIVQDEDGEEVIVLRGAFLNQYTQTMYTIGLENGRSQMLDEMNAQEFESQNGGSGNQQQQEGTQKRMVMSQPNQPVDPYSATDYYHQMQTAMSPALDPRNTFNQQVITEPDSHHEQLMLEYLERLYPNTSREYLLQILRGR